MHETIDQGDSAVLPHRHELEDSMEERRGFPVSVPQVYLAINEVMGKLAVEGISKDQKNTAQGYKFRGIDDVYNALAPHLAAAKLVILPSVKFRDVVERRSAGGATLFYTNVTIDFTFVSAIDGSSCVVTTCGEAMDTGDKSTNKAMSAAFKYACLQSFCIPTEGDNDADASTHDRIEPKTLGLTGYIPPETTAADAAVEASIKTAKSLAALKLIWDALPIVKREKFTKLMTARKTELTPDAPAVP